MTTPVASRPALPIVWICACFTLFTAIVPFVRAFFRVEISYNEGWNLYNAITVAHHGLLYPVKYGWTSVNYPMLSFALMAALHPLTHDYLFTARTISLLSILLTSALIAAIVRKLCGLRTPAILAGLFCLALFCAAADQYVGSDDPQLLAQLFFIAGLYLYLQGRNSLSHLAAVALLFVLGGSIKHSQIDIPAAVLIDLLFLARTRAAWFTLCGLIFAALSIALNIHFGGPYFIPQILGSRGYSIHKVYHQTKDFLTPLLPILGLALFTAWKLRRDPQKRIAALLLLTGLIAGAYFTGGYGVWINAYFTALLAISLLIGLFFAAVETRAWSWPDLPQAVWLPLLVFATLLWPMIPSGDWRPIRRLGELAAAQRLFDTEVAAIRRQPGPALCESLLRCYFAGKPYLYDPFNATRLVASGKLDPEILAAQIRQRQFAVIQLAKPMSQPSDRFFPQALTAMQGNYVPALQHPEVYLYLPALQQP